MLKKWPYFLLAAGLVILQLLIESNLNFLGGRINLALVVLVILINFSGFSWVVAFAVISGLVLDIYSSLPFGLLTFSLFFSAIGLKVLFENFFTNFSFYSLLLLGLISVALYNLIFVLLLVLFYFIGLSDYLPAFSYVYKIFWQIFSTELILAVAYFFINSSSKKFKPVFLG